MKHLILTLSLILGATSVRANDKPFAVGDVFFCQMEKSVQWVWDDEKQFRNYKPERFKFSIVDNKTIKFGSTSPFSGYEMEITDMHGNFWINAKSEFAQLIVWEEKFSFIEANGLAIGLSAAICDRF